MIGSNEMKPLQGGIRQIMLPCGKVGELDDSGVTYTCLHCKVIVGSKDEPADCKTKREKAEPRVNDWWLMADEEIDGKQ